MFFQKAFEGRNSWWRWLLTTAGVLIPFVAAQIPAILFYDMEAQRLALNGLDFTATARSPDFNRTVFLALALLPFPVAFAAFRLLVPALHRRPFLSILTGRARFAWRRLFIGAALWFGIIGAAVFFALPPGSYSFTYDPVAFWLQLLVVLAVIPIQSSTEEVMFRGYLTQGAALLTRNKLLTLALIALAFAAIHAGNPEFSQDYQKGFRNYLTMSIFLGLVAMMDDGIGLACGIHIANNIFSASIVSARDGTFTTDSLFQTDVATLLAFPYAVDLSCYAVALIILFVVFRWRIGTLFEPIRPAPPPAIASSEGALHG
jgi:membrane protease YdiL (CAAX protease family)